MVTRVLWVHGGTEWLQEQADLQITHAATGAEVLAHLRVAEFQFVLISLPLADTAPELLIEDIYRAGSLAPVIIHAAHATLADAVSWTKLGAYQVFQDISGVTDILRTKCGGPQNAPPWRSLLIGQSHEMHNIAEIVRLVAPRRCTVLITGETGTGKEVVARSVHAASNRAHLDMVSVNCSALPENLLEAELFGHVKGAFTGAVAMRAGRFEQAQHSTLFLDEIGDMPLALQSKLLRVLQEREFQRLGSSETIRADVRVIAATNTNLLEQVREGNFREDLYYRLNVVPISLPPLRDRPADIPLLAGHFVEKICREEGVPAKQIWPEVLERLKQHDWPGNVRQLENAVEMAIALSGERRILYPSDFPLPAKVRSEPISTMPFIAVPDHGLDFERIVNSIELNLLQQALKKTGGNKKLAAGMLGLKRTTLAAKLKSLSDLASAVP